MPLHRLIILHTLQVTSGVQDDNIDKSIRSGVQGWSDGNLFQLNNQALISGGSI